jgi:hypothetical protein
MPETTQTEEAEVKQEEVVQTDQQGESTPEAPEQTEPQPQQPSPGDTQQQINQLRRSMDKQIAEGTKTIKSLQVQIEERNEELEIYKMHSEDPDKLQEELVERRTKRAVAQREQEMTQRELSLEARELSLDHGVPMSAFDGAVTSADLKIRDLEWRLNNNSNGTRSGEQPVPQVPLGNPGGFDSSMIAARQFITEGDVRDAYIKGQIDQDSRNREMKRLGVSGY